MPSPGTDPRAPGPGPAVFRLRGHTARDRAAQVLLRLHHPQAERRSLTVQQAVDAAIRRPPRLGPADAALLTELIYGSLRRDLRLRWLLHRYLRQPDKLPPAVRTILLVASYELLHLDRVPAHATVNWAVQAVRDNLGSGLAHLVNAVLRRITRLGEAPREDAWYAAQMTDSVERLAIVCSIPAWIVRLWLESCGPETTEALARAAGRTPWPAARINMARPGWETLRDALLQGEAQSVGSAGILFPPGRVFHDLSRLANDGALSWQGAGSQRLLHRLQADAWDGPVWDACAGRGGKTCALLEMGRDVRLASDPHLARLQGLRQELDRLGLPHPELRQGQAQELDPGFIPRTVLLDVPCSGLGALARRPDTRLRQSLDQTKELAAGQQAIIDAAWGHLAPGGRLAYLTCTVNPAENEHQTARLLTRPDARLEIEIPARPESHGEDSMYGVVVRKTQ